MSIFIWFFIISFNFSAVFGAGLSDNYHKKNNSVLLLFIGIILSSCGDGASMKDNAYLGQLPSISKEYQDKEEKYEEKAKNATDMDDAYNTNLIS